MSDVQAGQLWEYVDHRTGWSYTMLIIRQRVHRDVLTVNYDAFVLYWDASYELDVTRMLVVAEHELRTWYKRIA